MLKKLTAIFMAVTILAGCVTVIAESSNNGGKWELFEIESAGKKNPKMSYWVYTPENMRPGLPLVVYLHSSTGMGKNALRDSFPSFVRSEVIYNPDAVIVILQHPGTKEKGYWDEVEGSVNRIVDYVIEEYEIDESRVSLTGCSLGGIGVWDIAEAAPGRYKRILSVCGRVKGSKDPSAFKGSEIRVYTVPNDANVNSTSAINFIEPLNEAGAKAVHIEMQSTHARVPIHIYGDPEVQEWLYLKEAGTAVRTIPEQSETELEAVKVEDDPNEKSEEWKLKGRNASFNKVVEINGRHYVVYAQNSPEYSEIKAGENGSTNVGGSTCSSFALANVLINTVNYDDLKLVREIARSPIKIDTKSVLIGKGIKEADSFELSRDEDLFRYFPLALINVIGGNNVGYGNGLGNTGSYKTFFKKMNIRFEKAKKLEGCVDAVENEGAMVVICTGSAASPIANQYGHFFVMASVKDNRVYFLDSMFRSIYKLDKDGIIFVQEPGVFWVDKENLGKLCIYGTSFIVYPNENRTEYTQKDYNELIEKSNIRDSE